MSSPETRGLFDALRRFAALWGFAVFLLVVLIVFRAVVLPFVLGVLVAYVLAPLVARLSSLSVHGRRLPRGASVLLVYLGLAGALAVFFTAFVPHLSGDFVRLFHEAPHFLKLVKRDYVPRADRFLERTFPSELSDETEPRPERKLTVVENPPGQFQVSLENLELELDPAGKGRYVIGPRSDADDKHARLSDLMAHAARATETELREVVSVGRRFVGSVIKTFAWFILTFMVAAYLLVDVERVMAFLRSLVPEPYRIPYDELSVEIDRSLSGVIRGQMIICLVNAVLTTIGLVLFRVKYALLLGMLAGVMSFIPVFGSILSSVPIVTVALTSGPSPPSLSIGLAALAWIIGIHFLEANVFNPKIIGGSAKIHPVVVVFALLAGETSGGLIGALLAVPIASIVVAAFAFFRRGTKAELA